MCLGDRVQNTEIGIYVTMVFEQLYTMSFIICLEVLLFESFWFSFAYSKCNEKTTMQHMFIFIPPFEKGGHIALHLSVGWSVGRYVGIP